MYDPRKEAQKAVQDCLQTAYRGAAQGQPVPDAMQALLDRMAALGPSDDASETPRALRSS